MLTSSPMVEPRSHVTLSKEKDGSAKRLAPMFANLIREKVGSKKRNRRETLEREGGGRTSKEVVIGDNLGLRENQNVNSADLQCKYRYRQHSAVIFETSRCSGCITSMPVWLELSERQVVDQIKRTVIKKLINQRFSPSQFAKFLHKIIR